MRRSHALFLLVLVGVAAIFASYVSASGQCKQPPSSGGGEKAKGSGSGCGAAVDGDDEQVEIIKMSSINFEKTIAGEVDEPEDSITLVLFEGEEKRCELRWRERGIELLSLKPNQSPRSKQKNLTLLTLLKNLSPLPLSQARRLRRVQAGRRGPRGAGRPGRDY